MCHKEIFVSFADSARGHGFNFDWLQKCTADGSHDPTYEREYSAKSKQKQLYEKRDKYRVI